MERGGDQPRRQREPVRDQPVREGRQHGVGGRHPREVERGREAGLDEAQAARRDGDHGQHHRGDVREQHEGRPGPRSDRGQRRQQRQVVEQPVAERAQQRLPPLPAERGAHVVAFGHQPVRQVAERFALALQPVSDDLDRAADGPQRPVGPDEDGAHPQREGEHAGAEPGGLREAARHRPPGQHRRKGEQREREERRRADDGGGREPGADGGGGDAGRHQEAVADGAAGGGAPGHDAAERVAGELRRRDREPLVGAQGQPLQQPDAREARDLDHEHDDEPDRVQREQLRPGLEHLQEARPQDVERDQREQQQRESSPDRASVAGGGVADRTLGVGRRRGGRSLGLGFRAGARRTLGSGAESGGTLGLSGGSLAGGALVFAHPGSVAPRSSFAGESRLRGGAGRVRLSRSRWDRGPEASVRRRRPRPDPR